MAEELAIKIIGDAENLKSALGKAEKNVSGFADKIGNIGKIATIAGTAITGAFTAIVYKTAEVGDQFDKMSKRTGVAVEDLSALAYACNISGTNIEGLEVGLKFLTKGMDDAANGTGLAKDAFEYLGISVVDVEGNLRPTIDVLKEAATKIAAIEDPTKQAALAMELFGARSGTQLVPLLKEGGAGIEELMEKAKDLGIVISTEAATKAAEFTDRMTDLKESLAGAGRDIGMILIPPLTELAEKAIEIIKNIREWADAHKPLVEMIVKVGVTLGALAAVGGPILLAVSAFMKMQIAITAVSSAIKLFVASSGPIGWLILAVGGLYTAWETNLFGMKDITEKVIASIKGNFVDLADTLGGGGGGAGAFFGEIEEGSEKVKESFEDILAEVNRMSVIGEIFQPAEEAIKKLTDIMTPYEKQLEAINTKYDESIEKIKTYITEKDELKSAIDKLNKGREAEITLLDKQKIALEDAAEAKKKLEDLTKSLTDKIYEFTHTEEEVKLRDINREYDLLIENAKEVFTEYRELKTAIDAINTKRQEEIDSLIKTNEAIEITATKNEELKNSYEELKPAIEEIGEVAKETAESTSLTADMLNEAFGGVVKHIDMATVSLSNFTKEGLAAAIASTKMSFAPLIADIKESMEATKAMFFAGQLGAVNYSNLMKYYANQLKDITDEMNEQISIFKSGYADYQNLIKGMSGGSKGGSLTVSSYQTGTPYVPKTSLALIHEGEAVIPKEQNKFNQQKYSNNFYVNVKIEGDGEESKIKRTIEKTFEECIRQYKRRGYELVY